MHVRGLESGFFVSKGLIFFNGVLHIYITGSYS